MRSIDDRVAGLAEHQHGLVTIDQLLRVGATRAQIRHRVGSGRWRRRGRHVVAIAGSPATWRAEVLAAVLDAGPTAVATGRTAAALWGFDGLPPLPAHVLVKRGGSHHAALGVLHETFWLPEHHRSVRDRVPVVALRRLPFELAATERVGRVDAVVDEVIQRGVSVEELALVVAELCRRGRPGSAAMRRLVSARLPGYVPPASALERAFRELCRRFDIPEPDRQVEVGGELPVGRVDVLWRLARLIVELDSRRWHDGVRARESDRHRDNALVLAGYRVVRITWRMIHDDPDGVARLLRQLLGLCGGSRR